MSAACRQALIGPRATTSPHHSLRHAPLDDARNFLALRRAKRSPMARSLGCGSRGDEAAAGAARRPCPVGPMPRARYAVPSAPDTPPGHRHDSFWAPRASSWWGPDGIISHMGRDVRKDCGFMRPMISWGCVEPARVSAVPRAVRPPEIMVSCELTCRCSPKAADGTWAVKRLSPKYGHREIKKGGKKRSPAQSSSHVGDAHDRLSWAT